jgi:hypothetical protein
VGPVAVPAPAPQTSGTKEHEMTKTVSRRGGQQYIANESFVINVNGIDKAYHQGRTRVHESDEAYKKAPHLFDLLEDHDESQSYA